MPLPQQWNLNTLRNWPHRIKQGRGSKKKIKKYKSKFVIKIAQGAFKAPSTTLHYQFTEGNSCAALVPSSPCLYREQSLQLKKHYLHQVQAGDGGRLHKGDIWHKVRGNNAREGAARRYSNQNWGVGRCKKKKTQTTKRKKHTGLI